MGVHAKMSNWLLIMLILIRLNVAQVLHHAETVNIRRMDIAQNVKMALRCAQIIVTMDRMFHQLIHCIFKIYVCLFYVSYFELMPVCLRLYFFSYFFVPFFPSLFLILIGLCSCIMN